MASRGGPEEERKTTLYHAMTRISDTMLRLRTHELATARPPCILHYSQHTHKCPDMSPLPH